MPEHKVIVKWGAVYDMADIMNYMKLIWERKEQTDLRWR